MGEKIQKMLILVFEVIPKVISDGFQMQVKQGFMLYILSNISWFFKVECVGGTV